MVFAEEANLDPTFQLFQNASANQGGNWRSKISPKSVVSPHSSQSQTEEDETTHPFRCVSKTLCYHTTAWEFHEVQTVFLKIPLLV